MKELGYKANPWAQKMQNTKTKMIALIAPYENNLYAESILRFLTKQFKSIGYTCMIQHLEESEELNPELFPVDGFILLFNSYELLQKNLKRHKRPYIVFDNQKHNGMGIKMDRFAGSVIAAEHFLKKNHHYFAFLGKSKNNDKYKGYSRRLKKDKKEVLFFKSINEVIQWMEKKNNQNLAIYCEGQVVSFQLALSINSKKWKIDKNLSFIFWGITNTELQIISELSYIGQPPANLCQTLIEQLNLTKTKQSNILIMPELITPK